MAIGAGIGAISGLLQGQQAKRLNKQYDAAEKAIQTTDPAQMAFLNRLRQQERAFRTGTDKSSAFALNQAQNVNSNTQANLLRAGGAGAVNNLLRSQAVSNNAIANIGADAAGQANQLMELQSGIIDQIADRNFARQRELRNQAMSRAINSRQNLRNMFQGALAMVPGITGQMGGFGPKSGGAQGRVFDPLASTSEGVGTFYPGAYNSGDMLPPATMPGQMPSAQGLPRTPNPSSWNVGMTTVPRMTPVPTYPNSPISPGTPNASPWNVDVGSVYRMNPRLTYPQSSPLAYQPLG